jgi:hypothetical protein
MRSCRRLNLIPFAALGLAASVTGCGGSEVVGDDSKPGAVTEGRPDSSMGHDGSTARDGRPGPSPGDDGPEPTDAHWGDAGSCPSDVDADLVANGNGPGQVVAIGSATSGSVDCTFCGLGVALATSTDPDVATLYISPSVSATGSSCAAPSDASGVWISGQLALGAAAKPGVYHGSPSSVARSSNAYCNSLTVSYTLPYPAGTVITDCGDSGYFYGHVATCPVGCISSCAYTNERSDSGDSGLICSPCESEQSPPEMQYELENGCTNEVPLWGSWTVTLTSVVPAVVPADASVSSGVVFSTVHGSLTATLSDGYDPSHPTPSVTVSLTF